MRAFDFLPAPLRAWLVTLAGLSLPLDAADAQPGVRAEALRRCAEIGRDAERLACFDALVERLAEDAPAVERDTAAAPPSEPAPDIDAFGAELIGDGDGEAPEQIESRLVGEFTGWRGNTEFRLENGQVWRQIGQGRLVWSADSPVVTIRRGVLNSYRLSVEGINASVRVRRVR